MKYLSERICRIDTSEVRKAFDLASKIKRPKDLSIGQPDFPVPEQVKQAITRAMQDNHNDYSQTQGILPLREALSEHYARRDIQFHPENIVVSTGVASVLFLLFEVLFNPDDRILLIDPYFLIYQSLANYHQLNVAYLPEEFTKKDIEELKSSSKLKNLKAIIFATPSNPTGKILDKRQLQQLAQLSDELDALLISDEIYSDYDYENKFIHTASFHPERTLTLSGFSKSHAMTGLRVGYIAAPMPLSEITEKIATLQQHSIVCSPQPAQWGAMAALQTPMDNQLVIMKHKRTIVLSALEKKVNFTNPDGAFYVFPNIPCKGQDFVREAIKRELLLVPGYIFSRNSYQVRISYAQKEDILQEGLAIFLQVVDYFS